MIERKTTFSEDRAYRYTLWREWPDLLPTENSSKYCNFVGLNPSTADEKVDDNTIRRCINFSKEWGYGALCMTNIFGFRTKSPAIMKATVEPFGWDNMKWLIKCASEAGKVICAWGTHASHKNGAANFLRQMLLLEIPVYHLGLNADNSPKHPLYLKKSVLPTLWKL